MDTNDDAKSRDPGGRETFGENPMGLRDYGHSPGTTDPRGLAFSRVCSSMSGSQSGASIYSFHILTISSGRATNQVLLSPLTSASALCCREGEVKLRQICEKIEDSGRTLTRFWVPIKNALCSLLTLGVPPLVAGFCSPII